MGNSVERERERGKVGAELENTRGEEAKWHSAARRLSDSMTLHCRLVRNHRADIRRLQNDCWSLWSIGRSVKSVACACGLCGAIFDHQQCGVVIRLSYQQLTRVLVTSQTWDVTPASIGRSVPCRLLQRDTYTDCHAIRITDCQWTYLCTRKVSWPMNKD